MGKESKAKPVLVPPGSLRARLTEMKDESVKGGGHVPETENNFDVIVGLVLIFSCAVCGVGMTYVLPAVVQHFFP